MNILYEDNHLLGIENPINMPSQQDDSQDEDVLTMAKQYLKETYHKPGNVYVGLVHRLDRPVGGVMVLAKTSKAASRLAKSMQDDLWKKEYIAVIDGIIDEKKGTFKDYLTKDTKTNMVSVTDKEHGKESILEYEVLGEKNGHSLVKINLLTGRSHQIRVQFSSRGYPIVNDMRYHPSPTKGDLALYARRLSFKKCSQHVWAIS